MTDILNSDAQAGERRALLEALLRQRAAAPADFALSYPQQRLWFLDQLQPESPVYNVPLAYHLRGPLDVPALSRAVSQVVRRHEVLRSVFRSVDGEPRQVVLPALPLEVGLTDLSDAADPRAAADEAALDEARRGFDLENGPLLRARLLRLGDEEHRLLLTLHHIVFDGPSAGVLARELGTLYGAEAAGTEADLPPLPIQYADFSHWQQRHLRGEALDELLAFWKGRLQGAPSLAGLPTDHPRPPVQTYRGGHLRFQVPPEVAAKVEALGRAQGATPFMTLLAAFLALVQRYTGEDQVVVGTPVANRARAELEPLIGFFTNTLVVRADLAGDPAFPELLRRVRAETLAAHAHQDLPFEKLVDELHPDRNLAQNPLFQVLFSYREGEEERLRLPGLDVEALEGDSGTAKFDLTLSLTRAEGQLRGRLEYSSDLFEQATAERMVAHFQTLLAAIAQDADRPLSALPVLPEDEAARLLDAWNQTDAAYPRDALLHELIAAQAGRTPDAEALVSGGQTLTYRQLDEAANRLARRLRALGVGPDVPVGVFLERSAEMVVALLGILKAGGAYLPLDPAYPRDRLAMMVDDSRAPVVVTRQRLARRVPGAARVVSIDGGEVAGEDAAPLPSISQAGHLAYVIYTSGSTGRPKGVMITHRNAANFFTGMDAVLGTDAPGTWLAVTSISFDISVLELLWTLARGYRVVVRGDEPVAAARAAASAPARPMDFSLFYFGGKFEGDGRDRYRLLLEGARFADRNGFSAVWTPERHFHRFGGLYPNPSVTGAAIAAITERIHVRAGSVVMPLHDPLRVAEEWSVIDNLSNGRAGISFASGWHANDFAFAPDRYADRKEVMMRGIDEVRRLWRGEKVKRTSGGGTEIEVGIYPPPMQAELPIWITSARTPDTFRMAGEVGAGLLTHLVGHSPEQLAEKIQLYRQAWKDAGHPGEGHVTLMLHTFVGPDVERVRELVREPLCNYLKTSFDLLSSLGTTLGREIDFRSLPEEELDALVRQAFGRFFETAGLLGTPESCVETVARLSALGVDEVACLVDFGVDETEALAALEDLAEVRELYEERLRVQEQAEEPIPAQLIRHGVTHLQCTPSVAQVLLADAEGRQAVGDLQKLLVGGEALPPALAGELADAVGGSVHNMYGPTETTVWSATHPVTSGDAPVPIGRPIANTRIFIVDRHLRPAPTGIPGELLIGGEGVVRGYLGRPSLTAERFVPDPFGATPGARLYRTGDLARWRASGRLEFLGRLDHQVKVRGHRIELGEIEAALGRHPGVAAAVVAARGEGAARTLAAYVVPAAGARLETTALAAALRGALPDYMVPTAFVVMDELPKTPNGKVDRKALPDPAGARSGRRAEFKPPESTLEQAIAQAWRAVLKLERVGVDDNFFEIGGNSLLVVQVRTRLLPIVEGGLSLVDMFRYPTIGSLAAALEGRQSAGQKLEEVGALAGRRKEALAQQARRRRDRRAQ